MSDLARDDDRFVPASVAAHLSGVDPRTIRRWAARGQIPVKPSPRGRLVDLVAVRRLAGVLSGIADSLADTHVTITRIVADPADSADPMADHADPILEGDHDLSASGSASDPRDPTAEAFIRHIAQLEQTILELSGRLGWMSKELELERERSRDLEQQVKLLSAPTIKDLKSDDPTPTNNGYKSPDPAPTSTAHRSSSEQNGPDSASYERESRPWWRRWLRLSW